MKITYFSETDTALFDFLDGKVDETMQIKDNLFLDFDGDGNLLSLTIGRVGSNTDLDRLSLPQLGKSVDLGLISGGK
ncbi:MAG: DUF2283 domain-containing protein [Candidatus Dadabacteria bacterium]|nr:DUF2283 domain-containing protein [Candidatus Dadabacteria bacterium]